MAPGDPDVTPADWAALGGTWSWFGKVVGPALAGDQAAPVDDDLAHARPWGFAPATLTTKVLVIDGADDLMTKPRADQRNLRGP